MKSVKKISGMKRTTSLNFLWRKLGITPRELRKLNPDTLTLDEARALSVHAWLTAPLTWKTQVIKRLTELEESAPSQ